MQFVVAAKRLLYDSAVPNKTPEEWARICRVEAAWTLHPPTKALLLGLAREYEAMALASPLAPRPRPDLS
jgi:hypothetical protein